jgi:hypothetical protein
MPLVQKSITHSKAKFAAWLCCFPCTIVSALVCIACCKCGKALDCICAPCDDELEDKAGTVASRALFISIIGQPHEKLRALETAAWDSASLFGIVSSMESLHDNLYLQIKQSVLNVLNAYNFNGIRSEDLTEDELGYIGDRLRNAIFNELPSKEDFEQGLQTVGIASNNTNALNGYLAGIITRIIGGNFIYTQLNHISDEIVLKRASNALVSAQAQLSVFNGFNAANLNINNNLGNNAGQPPLQQSPAPQHM